MRVAFISRNTLFTGKGGDTIQILKTADYLGKLGVEVDIFTSSQAIKYEDYDILHGFNVIRPGDLLSHFKNFKKIKILSTIYVDYSEFDVKGRGGLKGKLFKLLGNDRAESLKAFMRMIKNGDKSVGFSYFLKGHKNAVKELIHLSDLLLPNSVSEYQRLVKSYGVEKPYRVIPNAIDTKIFKQTAEITNKQKNLVLCVARIDGVKNQLNLIKALKNTHFELKLIGKPAPNHIGYYDACRAEASENISFIEHMEQEELINYYQKATVHAMPSWFETTGLSSLEAVAAGCNIVISNRGDQQEYFDDAAFYCDPENIKSIYEAVCKASEASINAKFRDKVFSDYTWLKTAEKTLDAYHACQQSKL